MDTHPPMDYAASRVRAAWSDLNSCRVNGMGLGAIPWTAVISWCDFHGFDREATETIASVIMQLDRDLMERERKRRATEAATKPR